MTRPRAATDEDEVLPSITVIVQKASACAHRLGEPFLAEGAGDMLKIPQPGLHCDMSKLNGFLRDGGRCFVRCPLLTGTASRRHD